MYYEAAMWIGMALLAALVSIRIALPVALVEIVIGAIAGNLPGIKEHLAQADFVTFLAGVSSIMLTFWPEPRSTRYHFDVTGRRRCPLACCLSPCPFLGPSGSVITCSVGTSTPLRSEVSPCPPLRSLWCTRSWWRQASTATTSAS